MNNSRAYILTACHNEKERILMLLGDLSKQTYTSVKIVVVDAGSTDSTPSEIKSLFPDVQLISISSSNWWTGSIASGVHWILDHSKSTDFIITINADCRIKKDYVAKLTSAAKSHPRSLIGSTIIDETSGRIADAAVTINWQTGKYSQHLPTNKKSGYLKSDVLSTKGTIYPVQSFLDVGNFDVKHFPHYLSDYEFSLRAKRRGYHLLSYSDSRVINDMNRTGIGESLSINQTLSQLWEILFSHRSRQNILDHYHFIRLATPQKYRLRNYLNLLIKTLYLVATLYPFGFIVVIIKKVKKINFLQT